MAERRVAMVAYDQAELLDIACVTTTLEMANELGADPPYRLCVATPGGTPVRCVSGLVLHADQALERLRGPLDTLVISGGRGPERVADDPALVADVRRLAARSRRVASVCTGATVLAATGLLDGRRATTHWAYARRLAARHPRVKVDADPIYIRDGNIFTSAGVTSALDLTLALVQDDHGPETARDVARAMVTYLHRPGNQAQMSVFVAPSPPEHDVGRRLVDHVLSHLDDDLSGPVLARLAGVSERHLRRLFVNAVDDTPARFVRKARLEAASQLLTTTALPIAQIARRCGFHSGEALRQAFVSHYQTTPSQFRSAQRRATSG